MFDFWDANARAIIAFSLAMIALVVVFKWFRLDEVDSKKKKR